MKNFPQGSSQDLLFISRGSQVKVPKWFRELHPTLPMLPMLFVSLGLKEKEGGGGQALSSCPSAGW